MKLVWLCLLTGLCISCFDKQARFRIGVSQCSDDEWRDKMNREIQREALFYDGVEVETRNVPDDDSSQISDIRYFIQRKVDLLIIAPNSDALTPVVEEVMDAGIPVVLIDRKTLSDRYSAFIGADNYQIGQEVGRYISKRLQGKGRILEIKGLEISSPARQRHEGMMSILAHYPEIRIVGSGYADWQQKPAERLADSLFSLHQPVDMVIAQNDRMAAGVYNTAREKGIEKQMLFVGIDGLPGYGLEYVIDSILDATFIYPTGGDRTLQLAMNILEGRPYEKENMLSTGIIDSENARILKLQTDQIAEQEKKVELLTSRITAYLTRYANQQLVLVASLVVVFLLIGFVVMVLRAYRMRQRMNRELMKRNEEITHQKEQLEEQRDQLIGLSRQLEEATYAKLAFFTNVSHDLRTPLTLIADPVDQLLEDKTIGDKQSDLLQLVKKNINVLLRLVNQILDFRKYENGKLEVHWGRHDLCFYLREWVNMFAGPARRKHIRVEVKMDNNCKAEVDCDLEKVERICYNLLSNAFKFTPENGCVTVVLAIDQEVVRISVSDTGIGIPQEYLNNIFERFYQVGTHNAGSGIGLALVKAFTELHRGKLDVQSQEGKGTQFTVTLPVHQMQENFLNENIQISVAKPDIEVMTSAEEISLPQEVEVDRTKECVLVIDDNPDIRQYIAGLLSRNYCVVEAADGQEGITRAVQYVPDVIISDVMMPVMDGIECCRQLKSELSTSHIPVILLTACAMDEQRIEGFEKGADSYISKPFNAKVLEARVRNLIEGRRRLHDNRSVESREMVQGVLSSLDKTFLERFREQLDENLSNPELNVEELGKSLGLSRVQLYRKIKSLTNYSPNELLRMARLKKAVILLGASEMTVAEIAYEVGFSSPSYFSKCYKEQYGETPVEYLKRVGRA